MHRLLSSLSRHISLNTEETAFFTSLLTARSLKAGEFLLREGEVCKYESFIVTGCLKSYYTDENGTEHIVDFLVEEWWADDLYSFFTGKPASSNIKAIEDSELLQISKPNLKILYQKIPGFERFFRILFQNAYISQKEQINGMLSTDAEDRYRAFLEKKPYAEARFSQKDIASYLGITPQFLSTMKKRLNGQ
jgi:CRP-like cAMP-binding protein